jgi:hypothetical protein
MSVAYSTDLGYGAPLNRLVWDGLADAAVYLLEDETVQEAAAEAWWDFLNTHCEYDEYEPQLWPWWSLASLDGRTNTTQVIALPTVRRSPRHYRTQWHRKAKAWLKEREGSIPPSLRAVIYELIKAVNNTTWNLCVRTHVDH